MLSIFADSLGQASNFQSVVINGCSPQANLIFPACLGKCLGAIRIKLTNMLSIFVDTTSPGAVRRRRTSFRPACLGKCLVSNKSSLYTSCEEFKHSKSIAARARLLQIQIGADCLCRSRALATKVFRFRLVRLRSGCTANLCAGLVGLSHSRT